IEYQSGFQWLFHPAWLIGTTRFKSIAQAGLAQWQCSGFVNRRSGVRIPHPAPAHSVGVTPRRAASGFADRSAAGNDSITDVLARQKRKPRFRIRAYGVNR